MTRDIHGSKRGRNEPCWCGSGLKYKRCHLDRAEQSRPQAADVVANIYKSRDNYRHCSCPTTWRVDCSGNIVRAHSLSKKQALAPIAENGHVYSLSPHWGRVFHKDDFSGQLVGVNQASTFTGFCGKHDSEIFLELDNEEFDGRPSQTFLSSYRTLSRELFAKIGQISAFQYAKNLDKGSSDEHQFLVQMGLLNATAAANFALKELNDIKSIFDASLVTNDLSPFDYKNFYFDIQPEAVAAGCFNPTHNLEARKIQDLSEILNPSENVCFSLLPTRKGFWASFLWLKEQMIVRDFVLDLDKRTTTAGTIYGIALAFVENCFLKPSAWNAMSSSNKTAISRLGWMGVADDDYSSLPKILRLLEQLHPTPPSMIVDRISER